MDSIYGLATDKLKKLYPHLRNCEYKEFDAAIKTVFGEAGDDVSDCPYCCKSFND